MGGIGRAAEAQQLAEHRRTARHRAMKAFEHEHRCAFAQHQARAVARERSACFSRGARIHVREDAHRLPGAHDNGRHARLGATSECVVDLAFADGAERLADRDC